MKNRTKIASFLMGSSLWLSAESIVFANGFFSGIPSDFFNLEPKAFHDSPRTIAATDLSRLPPMKLNQLLNRVGAQRSTNAANGVTRLTPSLVANASPGHDASPSQVVSRVRQAEIEEHAATLNEARFHAQEEVSVPPAPARGQIRGSSEQKLKIFAIGSSLKVSLKKLEMAGIGSKVRVEFETSGSVQLFSRDSKIVRWDPVHSMLESKASGATELYIVRESELQIVAVNVSSDSPRDPLLAQQDGEFLKNLTNVLPQQEKPLTHQELSSAGFASSANEAENVSTQPDGLTLADTVAEVDATRSLVEERKSRFVYPELPHYKRFAIQVMDERSAPEQSLVYPAPGMTVRLLGTRVVAKTDVKGLAHFGDLPEGSRFWALVEDEKGNFVPTVSELNLPAGSRTEVLRTRTLTFRSYFAYQNVLDVTQDSNLASFCARVLDFQGRKPLTGVRVSLNSNAEGPFYFGSFGPHKDIQATEASGRFCFFNVQPGLSEVIFSDAGGYKTALTIPLFPGAHTEEDLVLDNQVGRRLVLAALPTATEQVYEEIEASASEPFHTVDGADVIAVGSNESLSFVSPGVLSHESGTSFKGRVYALSQTPEFENVVAAIDDDDRMTKHLGVLPLLPRGFAEDLYHELHQQEGNSTIPFDPALGQAVVFHQAESPKENVKISLVNSSGRTMQEAWYFGNTPGLVKAAFFNLEPGVYQVLVESQKGAILAIDTTVVDYWTTALVQTGGSVHYSLESQHQASLDN